MNPPFEAEEVCLLIDGKGRRYLFDLTAGGEFHYHSGTLSHDEIIGAPEGQVLRSSRSSRLVALRPRLADYILQMRRGAQVMYPKDIGPILHWADIGPGMTVLEAGTGSGALTMALVRAVGPSGRVVSVERREDHAAHARRVIERFFGEFPETLDLRRGSVEDVVEEVRPDRLLLDLPEPWSVVPAAAEGLRTGGVFCAYVPTVPQVQQLLEALRRAGCFIDVVAFEILLREWVAEGRSVRPSHRMVGHTGFIAVGRKTLPLRDVDASRNGAADRAAAQQT
ncbi:MAG: tRNA (adenine-N1)-methyltransferase [Acidimicrobiia bacterium]